MGKDPAFLFYASDFLVGVADLTMEERGQYITLLCLQQQKGALSPKTIWLCLGLPMDKLSKELVSKFSIDDDGNYYNERLSTEIENRKNYTESRRKNGSKGGRPKEKKEEKQKPYGLPYENHTEDEDENENISKDISKDINYNIFIDTYNSICTNLPKCQKLTDKRKKAIRLFLKNSKIDEFEIICKNINKSDWHIGKNERGWIANFDWVLIEKNYLKFLEQKQEPARIIKKRHIF